MPYKLNDPYRHKFNSLKYQVTNWHEYNQALKQRGSLTIWFDKKAIRNWYARPSFKPGAQRIYSNMAIEVAGMLRLVFRLPLRQTTGLLSSIAEILGIELRIPDFSTLSRRLKKLKIKLNPSVSHKGLHVIIDTTGLSVYGSDEIHSTVNGSSKFKGYRKLHIAINEHQEIVACELTTKHADDKAQLSKLIRQIPSYYDTLIADGNYDNRKVYAAIEKHNRCKYKKSNKVPPCNIIIPPRINAWARKIKTRIYPKQRSDHIPYRQAHGRMNWQKSTGYGERSLVEVAFYRYKKILGQFMNAIDFNNQKVEAKLACKVLNIMASLGMPKTVRIC